MKKRLIRLFLTLIIIGYWSSVSAEDAAVKQQDAPIRLITISQGIKVVLKDNRLIKISLPTNEMVYQDSLMARSALLPQLNANLSQVFNRYQPDEIRLRQCKYVRSECVILRL